MYDPKRMEELDAFFKNFIQLKTKAWEDFPEWSQITDEAIKEILKRSKINEALINLLEHSPASDAARSAILKLYSYETPLYGALNRANQCQDRTKINSLGPFARLLFLALRQPA